MTGWLATRPFAWAYSAVLYIVAAVLPQSGAAQRRYTEKEAHSALSLKERLEANLQQGEERLAALRAKHDALVAAARAHHAAGDTAKALSAMREVVQARNMIEFVERAVAQTRTHAVNMEQTEMTKEIVQGQREVARALEQQNLGKDIDSAEDSAVVMEDAMADMQELSQLLARPCEDDVEPDELLRELEGMREAEDLARETDRLAASLPAPRPLAAAAPAPAAGRARAASPQPNLGLVLQLTAAAEAAEAEAEGGAGPPTARAARAPALLA
jgi:hypothetical protein